MKFNELLKLFRERKHIKKAEVARYLGKTEGFIRQIENASYTPTYEICQKLAKFLELSSEEEEQFFEQAFLERIKNEHSFYNRLKDKKVLSKVNNISGELNIQKYQEQGIDIKCLYFISWQTKFKKPILINEIKEELEKIIKDSVLEFGHNLYSLNIEKFKVEILIEINPDMNILDFIKGIKSLSSGIIRNKFPKIAKLLPVLWTNEYSIYTIGNIQNDIFHLSDSELIYINNRKQG